MKFIPLTKGKYAIVDDADYERLSKLKWRYDRYAVRTEKRKTVYMHRMILETGLNVDHISGDRLDNRRQNLREATTTQNHANSKAKRAGFKGVSWDSFRSKWKATICKDYKRIHIGRYDTAEEAALAYNLKAIDLFGEFARLNEL